MSTEERIKGRWWLPDDPNNKLPGELVYGDGSGAKLSLIGHFFPFHDPERFARHVTVWGETISGQLVTLLDCTIAKGTYHLMSGGSSAEVTTTFAVTGIHFRALEELQFSTLSCKLTHLVAWVGSREISVRPDLDLKGLKLEARVPESITIGEWSGVSVSLDSGFNYQPGDHSHHLTSTCRLHLESSEPVPYLLLAGLIHRFQEILTFALLKPVITTDVKGTLPKRPDQVHSEEMRLYFELSKPLPKDERLRWAHFSVDELQQAPIGVFRSYLQRHHLFAPFAGFYFSTLYHPSMFLRQRLLALAHAAEAFHRAFTGGKYQSNETFQSGLLLQFNESIAKETDPDFRRSLKHRVKYLNEFSLRKRIADLVGRVSELAGSVIADQSTFAEGVANERNRLTHPEPAENGAEVPRPDHFIMCEQLSLVLELCLLDQLGFDKAIIRRVAMTSPRIERIRLNS